MIIKRLYFDAKTTREKKVQVLGHLGFSIEFEVEPGVYEWLDIKGIKVTYHFIGDRISTNIHWGNPARLGRDEHTYRRFSVSKGIRDGVLKKLKRSKSFINAVGEVKKSYEVYKEYENAVGYEF